ncbi:hypothetical protein Tco_0449937 [Tanacetum coccineum]
MLGLVKRVGARILLTVIVGGVVLGVPIVADYCGLTTGVWGHKFERKIIGHIATRGPNRNRHDRLIRGTTYSAIDHSSVYSCFGGGTIEIGFTCGLVSICAYGGGLGAVGVMWAIVWRSGREWGGVYMRFAENFKEAKKFKELGCSWKDSIRLEMGIFGGDVQSTGLGSGVIEISIFVEVRRNV